MGICSSCDSTSVTTAKLILQDGKLVEFSQSVRVSYVLQRNHGCFICNSDDMEFDEFISALSPEEELQLGQLYFALPVSRLRYPLQAEDMAALAVRASSALGGGEKCGGAGCRKKGVVPITCSEREEFKSIARGVGSGGGVVARRRKNGGKGPRFAAKLNSIEE